MTEKLNFDTREEDIWKGVHFWQEEIEQAGLKEKLRFFNDVITEKRPPHPDSGYREPVLENVILDNKTCDIYHSDHEKGDSWHRIFIHIKD
jgi:hypothetical protein